jgi:hypothetical protein
MPDFSNDDQFGAFFGQLPEHGARAMRSSGQGFGEGEGGAPAGNPTPDATTTGPVPMSRREAREAAARQRSEPFRPRRPSSR